MPPTWSELRPLESGAWKAGNPLFISSNQSSRYWKHIQMPPPIPNEIPRRSLQGELVLGSAFGFREICRIGAAQRFSEIVCRRQKHVNHFLPPNVYIVGRWRSPSQADSFRNEPTSKTFQIMDFSRLMSDVHSDTRWFANPANLFAAQPVRPQIRR